MVLKRQEMGQELLDALKEVNYDFCLRSEYGIPDVSTRAREPINNVNTLELMLSIPLDTKFLRQILQHFKDKQPLNCLQVVEALNKKDGNIDAVLWSLRYD